MRKPDAGKAIAGGNRARQRAMEVERRGKKRPPKMKGKNRVGK